MSRPHWKKMLALPAAASCVMLAACASGGTANDKAPATSGPDSAALIVAQGGLGDESYNDLANEGFKSGLEATGMTGSPIESNDVVGQAEQVLRRAGQANLGMVIDLEYTHNQALPQVAADYPETSWALVNAEAEGENVASIVFQEQEGSYLAGALAAMMTTQSGNPQINEDKVIGVIGGTQGVGIDKFLVGYAQGARDVDPDVEVLTAYSNNFGDPSIGQQLAQSMFDQGADIVYTVAGGTGTGVIQAAKDANRYAIGVDSNQDGEAPGHVLTSVLKNTDVAVESIMRSYKEGEFPGGETLKLGLAEDGVGLTEFEHTKEAIPAEFITRIADLKAQIIDGEVEVWNVVEQGYPDFFQGE